MSVLDSYVEPFKLLSVDSDELFFLKDVRSVYRWCSKNYASLLNVSGSNKILGLKDTDINPLYSSIYRRDDETVINTAKPIVVDNPAFFKELGIVRVTGVIKPIIGRCGQVEGILGKTTLEFKLARKNCQELFRLISQDNLPYIVNRRGYHLKTKYGLVKISAREAECFLYLLKGHSAKEISYMMDLKTKTIDSYIFNLKLKFSFSSKSELIEIILKAGLLDKMCP